MWGKFLNKVNYSGTMQLCVKGGKEGRKGGEGGGRLWSPSPLTWLKLLKEVDH